MQVSNGTMSRRALSEKFSVPRVAGSGQRLSSWPSSSSSGARALCSECALRSRRASRS